MTWYGILVNNIKQARSRGVVVRRIPPPPKSAKRSKFCYKMGQKWGFVRGVGPKGPLFVIKWAKGG